MTSGNNRMVNVDDVLQQVRDLFPLSRPDLERIVKYQGDVAISKISKADLLMDAIEYRLTGTPVRRVQGRGTDKW